MEEVKLNADQVRRLIISQCAVKEFIFCLRGPAPAQPGRVIRKLLRDAVEIQEPRNIRQERRVFISSNDWRFILDNDLSHLITCSRLSDRDDNRSEQRYRKRKMKDKAAKQELKELFKEA